MGVSGLDIVSCEGDGSWTYFACSLWHCRNKAQTQLSPYAIDLVASYIIDVRFVKSLRLVHVANVDRSILSWKVTRGKYVVVLITGKFATMATTYRTPF